MEQTTLAGQIVDSPGVEVKVAVPVQSGSRTQAEREADAAATREAARDARITAALEFHQLTSVAHDPVLGPLVMDLACGVAEAEITRAELGGRLAGLLAQGEGGAVAALELQARITATWVTARALTEVLVQVEGLTTRVHRMREAHSGALCALAEQLGRTSGRLAVFVEEEAREVSREQLAEGLAEKDQTIWFMYEAWREAARASLSGVPLLDGEIERVENVVRSGSVPGDWKADETLRVGDNLA